MTIRLKDECSYPRGFTPIVIYVAGNSIESRHRNAIDFVRTGNKRRIRSLLCGELIAAGGFLSFSLSFLPLRKEASSIEFMANLRRDGARYLRL